MGGSTGRQTVGYKIYMGEDLAFCLGPVDYLFEVRFENKTAFESKVAAPFAMLIDKEDLFGGEKKEGGVSGVIDFEDGDILQPQNTYLATVLDANVPGFRGIARLIFNKLYIGMNPYLRKVAARMQRIQIQNREGDAQWNTIDAEITNPELQAEFKPVYTTLYFNTCDDLLTFDGINTNPGNFTIVSEGSRTFVRCAPPGPASIIQDLASTGSINTIRMVFRLTTIDTNPSFPNDSNIQVEVRTSTIAQMGFNPRLYNEVGTPANWYTFISTPGANQSYYPCHFDQSNVWYRLEAILDTSGPSNTITVNSYVDETDELLGSYSRSWGGVTMGGLVNWRLFQNGTALGTDVDLFTVGNTVEADPKDMNPAHIIREGYTSKDYGMSLPEAELDDISFLAAAVTLKAEGFGLSLLWDEEMPVQEFINEMFRHIDGAPRMNRTTGLIEIKLVRNDYTVGSLITIDSSSLISMTEDSISSVDELINTVTVKFIEPVENVENSVTVQDIALIQNQGAPISTTITYSAIQNATLAARVAERDLRVLSSPLFSCVIEVQFDVANGLNIADVFVLDFPERGVNNLVMRITEINFGDGVNNRIKISCVEDIFSTEDSANTVLPETEWTDIIGPPAPSPERLVIESTYYEVVQRLGQSDVDGRLVLDADIGYLMVAGSNPGGGSVNGNLYIDNGSGYIESGNFDYCPSAQLDEDITHLQTTFDITGVSSLAPLPDTYFQMGTEMMYIDIVGANDLTVRRGIFDTLPLPHLTGEDIVFFSDFDVTDAVEYGLGDVLDIKLTTTTGSGELPLADAPIDQVTFDSRAIKPYPPGNFQLNALYYPPSLPDAVDVTITWAHRDRTQQTGGTIYDNTFGDIGPEVGTIYNIRIYDENDLLIRTYAGIVGTSQVYIVATELTDSGLNRVNALLRIELESERDTYISNEIYNYTVYREIIVIDRDLTAPPGGEVTGDSYIPAAPATGVWTGLENNILTFNGATWDNGVPQDGWMAFLTDEAITVTFNAGVWA